MKPNDETLNYLVSRLDEDLYELWEERAAVLEFDAGVGRDLSEARAYLMLVATYPKAVLKGLS